MNKDHTSFTSCSPVKLIVSIVEVQEKTELMDELKRICFFGDNPEEKR